MNEIYGFREVSREKLAEVGGDAVVYEHIKTGGRVLSIINSDENKTFGISFRTPPENSTGLAHILEHSVLCGSRKYPVKEPFVELLKGSLQTFLNAMTFPDKTVYPVASPNVQDFYNLVDVYLDAVFHPALTPNTLMQEGWHYVPGDDGSYEYKGVVFNEMKGVYSSPDSLLYEHTQHSIFPDNTYGLDSGGDPAVIPDLTFEDFMNFHERYYHPSNSYAFFYGDDDPDERLRILDEYFSEYDQEDPQSEIALQKSFSKPVSVEKKYAAEGEDSKSMVTVSFLLPEATSPEAGLAFDVLEELLIGLPSSPLRKALNDSGLGEDLAGAGFESELRQMFFSVGLKGISRDDSAKVEALILQTLRDLAEKGFDSGDIEAALNTVEFDLRENNSGSYPRGLMVMLNSLTTWLYDGDPLGNVRYENRLADLKKQLESGSNVFEDMIRRYFLENQHRTTVLLSPDTGLGAEIRKRETERLEKEISAMDEAELQAVAEKAVELKRLQELPDSPENLAKIPRLKVSDLPKNNVEIPCEEKDGLLFHDIDTSGILYLDLVFDMSAVPDSLLSLVPVFGRALIELGSSRTGFVELTRRIAANTGGISPTSIVGARYSDKSCTANFVLRAKSTVEKAPAMFDILNELLQEADFSNRDRLRQIILESKARFEHRVIPSGHAMAATRMKARFSDAGYITEQMSGISELQYLRGLAARIDDDFDSVKNDLEKLRDIIINKNGLLANVTVDKSHYSGIAADLEGLRSALPENKLQPVKRDRGSYSSKEGLCIPAQVNYVSKGAEVYSHGYEFSGSAFVVSRFLRTGYLWDRIRVQGGAYGSFAMFDRASGSLLYASYRDPNLAGTINEYDGIGSYLEKVEIDRDELEKAVIGGIGDIDKYQLPDAKGFTSLLYFLTDNDATMRQKIREEVLTCGQDDFRNFAIAAKAVAENGDIVVIGGREGLEKSGLDFDLVDIL
jgi:hypothetical protein